MAVGKLTPFYAGLGAVAVVGIALIARAALWPGAPALSLDSPVAAVTGPRGVTLGSDSAPVEIMEFSDFECPYCARFTVLQMPDVRSRLISPGRVRWRFVHFPLEQHTKSPLAHLAAGCANEQGRFWELHDLLFDHQRDLDEPQIEGYVKQAQRINLARWKRCMVARKPEPTILDDQRTATKLGARGTPAFFINGRFLSGAQPIDRFEALIDQELARAKQSGIPRPDYYQRAVMDRGLSAL
jgi:protein-disulfide isomerase